MSSAGQAFFGSEEVTDMLLLKERAALRAFGAQPLKKGQTDLCMLAEEEKRVDRRAISLDICPTRKGRHRWGLLHRIIEKL